MGDKGVRRKKVRVVRGKRYADFVVSLGKELFPYIKNPEEFFRERLERGRVFVALVGREPVGFVDVEVNGVVGKVMGVGVKEEWRGRGIGKKLMEKALEYLRRRGTKYVILYTKEENVAARRLYESLGFTPIERVGEGVMVYGRVLEVEEEGWIL